MQFFMRNFIGGGLFSKTIELVTSFKGHLVFKRQHLKILSTPSW